MPTDAPVAILETGVRPPIREKITQHGRPISLTKSILALEKGTSFNIDSPRHRGSVYVVAKKCGVSVSTHKLENGMLMVKLRN